MRRERKDGTFSLHRLFTAQTEKGMPNLLRVNKNIS
jgi:hypothetical protein